MVARPGCELARRQFVGDRLGRDWVSPVSARNIDLGKDREVRRSREQFLTEGIVSGRVRPAIVHSWERSRQSAVRADGDPAAGSSEFDPDVRLLRLARPILDRLGEHVSEPGMAVILTDSAGLVLDRRAPRSLLRTLDGALLAPGYFYSERSVGTNGIGTAAEDPNSGWVVGSEHYVEWLQQLSCAGAPIHNPITGEIEGVLDVTCRFEDTDPLMVPFIKEAARDVERQLYEDLLQHDREYFAKLIQRVEERARLRERQRLARELHDSVSQSLFGITLGVETASDLADRAPERVGEPLGYVRQLAQAGMAEMRAIIVGLRSEALESDGLVAGLNAQAQALEAHHGLIVDRTFPPEPVLSLDVKAELLRIGQEAMHNIAKHAHARRVQLRLAREEASLLLEIADDGGGFDTNRQFPGHLGLVSMGERIQQLGGRLKVSSVIGQGTRIRAQIPLRASVNLITAFAG